MSKKYVKFPIIGFEAKIWEYSYMKITELQSLIRDGLEETGLSERQASLRAIGRPDFIRDIKNGSMPSFDRVCSLLGVFDMHIDIKKGPKSSDSLPIPITSDDLDHYLVPRYNVSVSAGSGATVENEWVMDAVAFSKPWLQQHGLQAGQLSLIDVVGDSMQPTLTNGDMIMVDHRLNQPRVNKIVIARIAGDLVVKRVQCLELGNDRTQWLLTSDNAEYGIIPLRDDNMIVGEMVWCAHWTQHK